MGARYWRVSGIQTPSNALAVADFALSDGTTWFSSATLTGTLSPGFQLNWDLGSPIAIDRVKQTSIVEAGFATSFLFEQSDDNLVWINPVLAPKIPYPGDGADATLVIADPFSNATVLLLHGDGAKIVDSSTPPKTLTVVGSATSATQSKFGGKSIYLNGAGDRIHITPESSMRVGLRPFTVEGWFFCTGGGTYPTVFELGNLAGGGAAFLPCSGGTASLYTGGFYGSMPAAANVWNHIAWVRSEGMLTIYVNGVGSTPVAYGVDLYDIGALTLGNISSLGGSNWYQGYVDEFRFTPGVARYTANFTPPTGPFLSGITGMTGADIFAVMPTRGAVNFAEDTMPSAGVVLMPGGVRHLDLLDGGVYKLSGTVAEKATPDNHPLSRKVVLIDERDHRIVRETWSDAAGVYVFPDIAGGRPYSVLSYDHTHSYRAVVADNLQAEAQ